MTDIQLFKSDQIQNLIYTVRGKQVMLDRDLAILYRVQTGRLNEAVKRNSDRFPAKFMFQLTKKELNNWMLQIAISNKEKMGIRKMPYAFTEQGIAMLSAVLRSKKAITISIQIMDAFVIMRKFIINTIITLPFRVGLQKITNRGLQPKRIGAVCWAKAPDVTFETPPTLKDGVIWVNSHSGPSLKDLGKKISAFSRFEKDSLKLLGKLK